MAILLLCGRTITCRLYSVDGVLLFDKFLTHTYIYTHTHTHNYFL